MSEIPGITVGVDGSEPAAVALGWAARYARLRALPLTLVTGVGWPGERHRERHGGRREGGRREGGRRPADPRVAALKDASRIDGEETLALAADDVREAHPGLPVTRHVSDETGVDALLAAAPGSDTVVVGCRNLDPAASVLLGSVSTAVATQAPVPVVVVRADRHPGPDAPVVAGIDGSDQDETTLGAAFAEAERWGAPLVVAHAWTDASLAGLLGSASAPSWIEARHEADDLLDRRIGCWRERYPHVRTGTVTEREQPARMLVELSATAGLVVVGTSGRGSVTRRLLHHAEGPLLVTRPS